MEIPIVYEDEFLLCINKPPGIVVNKAQSVAGKTVQDFVEENYSKLFSGLTQINLEQSNTNSEEEAIVYNPEVEFRNRSGIVHRIDKETSGLLLVAKNPQVFANLKQQFMERTIKKTYLAIIHGQMPAQDGSIDAPIGRLPWNRERFGVVPDGKPSVTKYKVMHTYERKLKGSKEKIQLIECFPQTGRTHQIRVHLKYTNRPIVGDYLYAGRKTARDDRAWVNRVQLHAHKVLFMHPDSKQELELTAAMPQDMQAVLATLQLVA